MNFDIETFSRQTGQIKYHPLGTIHIQGDINSPENQQSIALYKQGMQLFERGMFIEAIRCLEQILKANSGVRCVHYSLAICCLRIGQFETAEKILQFEQKSSSPHPNTLNLLNDIQAWINKYRNATEEAIKQKALLPITLFAMPKAFRGHINIIQRNAIKSWTLLQPCPEIILLGDDEGTPEIAKELGLKHIPHVERSEFGTPLVNSIFQIAEANSANDWLVYINADVILLNDFDEAMMPLKAGLEKLNIEKFLLFSQRMELDIKEPLAFDQTDWQTRVRHNLSERGVRDYKAAVEMFFFSRGLFTDIPPFAIGRTSWDNWLTWKAKDQDAAIIDATESITLIHQSHDYSHISGGWQGVWKGVEAQRNNSLMGSQHLNFTLNKEAFTHVLATDGLRPGFLPENIRNDLLITRRIKRGIDELHSGNYISALDYLNDALSRSGGYAPKTINYARAVCLVNLQRLEEAEKFLIAECTAYPDNKDAEKLLAQIKKKESVKTEVQLTEKEIHQDNNKLEAVDEKNIIKSVKAKQMKILLISLPGHLLSEISSFPLGIGYLAAMLNKEYEVKALHYQRMDHALTQIPQIISSFVPHIVGLTCTTFNRGNVHKIIRLIKSSYPNIKIVLGGVHPSYLYEQALNHYGADIVVIGEGENTILDLCQALEGAMPLDDVKGIAFKKGQDIILTPPRQAIETLDDLPFPDYSFAEHLMKQSGMGFIIASRGCPVNCIFCSTSSYWGQRVRRFSVKRVVDEMELLVSRFKVKKIFFDDDTFNLSVKRVKETCNEIMTRKLNVEWGVDCRVKPVSQEMIDMMVEAGCRHICFGIESGSEEMLQKINKKITLDEIQNAYELCRKHHHLMSTGAFTMVGNPGESEKTIQESINFLNTIPLTDRPSTAVLCLLPGTPLYGDFKKQHPQIDSYWIQSDQILYYTFEQSFETLSRWSHLISSTGHLLDFDKEKHFWDKVLIGNIPKAELPEYVSETSEIDCLIPPGSEDNFSFIIQKAVASLTGAQVKQRVLSIISLFRKDHQTVQNIKEYQDAINLESSWFDALTFLNWYANHFKPDSYLEIGAGKGHSIAQVLAESPNTMAYGFGMWICDSDPNFAIEELKNIGILNLPTLSSHEALPAFWSNTDHPQQLKLIFVNGDPSTYGNTKSDLDTAFAHLALGGAIVFAHINQPELKRLWGEYKTKFPDHIFISDYFGGGTGIAFRPPFDKLEKLTEGFAEKIRLLLVYSIHPTYGRVTLAEWIKESLREHFSDEVEVFACGPGNEIDVEDSSDFYGRVARLVNELKIDAIWDVEGGAASLEFMFKRLPKNISVPKIFWAIDTHQFLSLQAEKAKHFDLTFSAQKNALPSLGTNAVWLPAGASLHEKDYQLERDIDVGFIGNISPNVHKRRKEIIDYLADEIKGLKVYTGVFLEEKAKLASRMKIMVNVSLNNDINFRVFETLACGAMLLTDKIYNNGLENLFIDGTHLVTFETKEELAEKIRYYLNHDSEREAIAKSGQDIVNRLFRHHMIIRYALRFIRQLTDSRQQNTPSSPAEKEEIASPPIKKCWCGGELGESVHPLYGQCLNCKTLVVKEQYTEEQMKDFYTLDSYWRERVKNEFNYPPIEQRAVNDFKDRIPVWYQILSKYKSEIGTLLEIGCMHGGFLHYCRQHGVQNVVGVEVDEDTCEFARKYFSLPYMVSGLFPDVSLPFDKFDAVTGFDVVEHFLDPVRALKGVANILKSDGICFFQVPCYRGEGKEWTQFKPEEHVFLYNAESIQRLFDSAGLETVEILKGYFPDDIFIAGRRKKTTANLLFIRTDAIGDAVLAASMLPHIREKYKDAKITVVCQEHTAELYQASPFVDSIISFNRNRAVQDEPYRNALVQHLKEIGADLALNSLYSREPLTDVLTIASEAKERIGFNGELSNISAEIRDKHNPFYTRIFPSDVEHKPELERHRDFLKNLGIDAPPLQSTIWTTPEDEGFADEFFAKNGLQRERTIALFPGAYDPRRVYQHYEPVLRHFEQFDIAVFGGNDAVAKADEICKNFHGRSYNLVNKTTIRQMASLMRRCCLCFGADSAGTHIACAVGIPNIVILGGGHFGRFWPYSPLTSVVCLPLECYGCRFRCRYPQTHCINGIVPEVVTEVVRQTLEQPYGKPRIFAQGNSLWKPKTGEPAWRSPDEHICDREKVALLIAN